MTTSGFNEAIDIGQLANVWIFNIKETNALALVEGKRMVAVAFRDGDCEDESYSTERGYLIARNVSCDRS